MGVIAEHVASSSTGSAASRGAKNRNFLVVHVEEIIKIFSQDRIQRFVEKNLGTSSAGPVAPLNAVNEALGRIPRIFQRVRAVLTWKPAHFFFELLVSGRDLPLC